MVLMLTAAGAPGDRVSGLTLGADDYLAKPFHFPELVLRIRALARRQPAARARTLRAAGHRARPGAPHGHPRRPAAGPVGQGVRPAGGAAARDAPAFLSAEDLLEQVWDEHADPFTNTVTVTIGRLRRKLGDPPIITTSAGRRLPHRRLVGRGGRRVSHPPAPTDSGRDRLRPSGSCRGCFGCPAGGHRV